jgi:hypothetical protein
MNQLPAKLMTAITTRFGIVQRLRLKCILIASLSLAGQNVRNHMFYEPPSLKKR